MPFQIWVIFETQCVFDLSVRPSDTLQYW